MGLQGGRVLHVLSVEGAGLAETFRMEVGKRTPLVVAQSGDVLDTWRGAPGRTRTLNRPGRNRLLYPLSYGRSEVSIPGGGVGLARHFGAI